MKPAKIERTVTEWKWDNVNWPEFDLLPLHEVQRDADENVGDPDLVQSRLRYLEMKNLSIRKAEGLNSPSTREHSDSQWAPVQIGEEHSFTQNFRSTSRTFPYLAVLFLLFWLGLIVVYMDLHSSEDQPEASYLEKYRSSCNVGIGSGSNSSGRKSSDLQKIISVMAENARRNSRCDAVIAATRSAIQTAIRLPQGKPHEGFCFDIPKNVTHDQIEEVVFQWLYFNPKTRFYDKQKLVAEALAGVWWCQTHLTPETMSDYEFDVEIVPSADHTPSVQVKKQEPKPANPLVEEIPEPVTSPKEQRLEPANPFNEPDDPE
jgi:hypothetical protein